MTKKLLYKNNLRGYYNFFYYFIGWKIWAYLCISIVIGFVDGFGLALFMPMLQLVNDAGVIPKDKAEKSMGGLHYVIDFMNGLGLPLTLFYILLTMVCIFLLKGILSYGKTLFMAKIQTGFVKKMRFGLVDNLRDSSYTTFLKYDAGSIQNVLVSEVYRVMSVFTNLIGFMEACVMLVAYITLAFFTNYKFTLLVLIGGALINLIYQRLYKLTKHLSNAISGKSQDFNRLLVQMVFNFKYLKSTAQFDKYAQKVNTVINDSENISYTMTKYGSIMGSIREPLVFLIISAIIILQVNIFHGNLSSILLALLFFFRCLQYIMNTQNTWQGVIFNSGGLNTVSDMWNALSEGKEMQSGTPYRPSFDSIEVQDLDFSYGAHRVLHGINFSLPRNKTIAFVGESGSGKTTMVNLLTGLQSPESGHILIDGIPLETMHKDSFRSHIGYISQDAVIFNDTVFNNVSFWDEPTPENMQRFWRAMELASIQELVREMPEAENTNLGDNGLRLSGGQKQRVSIARELYKNVELLIMDEATSALDSETEYAIKQNIESLKGHYTMVIIAHRLSTIKNADCIYLFDKGRITASGTFDELVEQSSRFKHMVELQEI